MPAHSPKRTIAVLWLATWAAFLCVGIPLAVLPRYVTGELGLGDLAAGFAVGSLSLSAMLWRPFGGRLADERGRRRVVSGGLGLCTLGGAGLLFVDSYPALIAARMVAGAGESWVYAAAIAWALDLSSPERHGRAIALFGMAIWLGAAAGTAIGEALLQTTGSYRAVWSSVVVIPALALAAMALSGREAPRPARTGPRGPLLMALTVRPGLALALANLGYGAVAGLATLHLASRGVASPGFVLTAVAAAIVLGRVAVAGSLDRFGPRPVLAAGCASQIAGLVGIAAAGTLPAAILAGFAIGLGYAAVFPALALMVVQLAPVHQRGAAMGSFTAFLDLGLAVGGPLAGAAAALLGRPGAFLLAAALTAVAIAAAPRPGGRGPAEMAEDAAPKTPVPGAGPLGPAAG